LTDITMAPGRVVHGRCVDPNGKPVKGAVVKAASDYDQNRATNSWAWDPRATDAEGKFQISIPRDSKAGYELWIAHPEYAPQRVVIPKQGDELADVRLQTGTVVKGSVTDENGDPIKGVVVVAESIDDSTLESVGFAVELATKTDSDGRYELPPIRGMYKVFLADAGKRENDLKQDFVVSDVRPPLVVPKKVAVSGRLSHTLDFAGTELLKASGTVRWEDGKPAVGCEVKASYLPLDFNSGIWIGQTWTDEDGHYEIPLPNPISDISIHVSGQHDANRKWHYAHPDTDVAAENKGLQFMRFKQLDADQDGIDWLLKPDFEDESK